MWYVYIQSITTPSIRLFATKKKEREEAERWMDHYPIDTRILKYVVEFIEQPKKSARQSASLT